MNEFSSKNEHLKFSKSKPSSLHAQNQIIIFYIILNEHKMQILHMKYKFFWWLFSAFNWNFQFPYKILFLDQTSKNGRRIPALHHQKTINRNVSQTIHRKQNLQNCQKNRSFIYWPVGDWAFAGQVCQVSGWDCE